MNNTAIIGIPIRDHESFLALGLLMVLNLLSIYPYLINATEIANLHVNIYKSNKNFTKVKKP